MSDRLITIWLLILLALLGGCGDGAGDVTAAEDVAGGVPVPLDAFQVPVGAVQTLARFDVVDGTGMRFLVLDSNAQPLALGLAYEGSDDGQHRNVAWSDIAAYSPFQGETPRPMLAGAYRVDVGCAAEATRDCLFALKVWLVVP